MQINRSTKVIKKTGAHKLKYKKKLNQKTILTQIKFMTQMIAAR